MSGFELEGVTLEALSGLDVTEIASKQRGQTAPKMVAVFHCIDCELLEVADSNTGSIKGFSAKWTFEIQDILKMLDPDQKIEDWVGKKYTESAFIQNTDGVSYALGFVEACGGIKAGSFVNTLKAVMGKRIQAVIKHQKKKDDPDIVYANLSSIKIVQ